HRRHDGIACDWVVDHLDGRERADHLWHKAVACRLSDCIRGQPLDNLFYLALWTAMRSGLPALAGTAKGCDKLPRSNKLPELRFNDGPVEMALAVIYAATEDDKRRRPFAPASTISNEPRCWVTTSRSARANAYSIVQIECGLFAWN